MIKQNPKTLLFSNGDFQKQAPLTFKECAQMKFADYARIFLTSYPNHRRNMGTFLMCDSLINILDAEIIAPSYDFIGCTAQSVVTNVLHLNPTNEKLDRDYWGRMLKAGVKIVPMTAGFMYNGENGDRPAPLGKDMAWLYANIAERNEIGVRGEMAAEILNDAGIKNVRIVGCPSLYYHLDRNFAVNAADTPLQSVNFNFSTCYGNANIPPWLFARTHVPLLRYARTLWKKGTCEVDFTLQKDPEREIMDLALIHKYGEFEEFFMERGRYFFSVADWMDGLKRNDFSFGSRFHGNVAAILAGVPTLMVNVDGRMREMNDYYKIPSIDMKDFDPDKPIEYYRELADYSEFNKNYAKTFDNFVDYCRKNDVALQQFRESGA